MSASKLRWSIRFCSSLREAVGFERRHIEQTCVVNGVGVDAVARLFGPPLMCSSPSSMCQISFFVIGSELK